jgi:signal transduction histidine kinase
MSVSVALTEHEVAALNQQVQVADDIERGAGDLSYLASQYLLYRQDQGRTLWWARFTSFSDDVSHLAPVDAEGVTLAASIKANREQLQAVFSDVSLAMEARSASQGPGAVAGAPDPAFLQLSWSRIEAVDQSMLMDASRLAQQLRSHADTWQGTNTVLGFTLLGLFAAYVIANYLMIYRRTLRSLDELRAGVEIVGSGQLEHSIPEKGRDEIAELTCAFNRMAANLKCANTQLMQREEALHNLSRRLVELQEDERRYVAGQLYDDEGQRLCALLIGLGTLQRDAHCPPTLAPRIGGLIRLTEGVVGDLHDLAVDLRPAGLDRAGLGPALRTMVAEFGRAHEIEAGSELAALEGAGLDLRAETGIFRIVQQALDSLLERGPARGVSVTVGRRPGWLSVIVEGDGVQFDVEKAAAQGDLGLLDMSERAAALGGTMEVESAPGAVTTFYLSIPLATF